MRIETIASNGTDALSSAVTLELQLQNRAPAFSGA
jgi:hypothetical protein